MNDIIEAKSRVKKAEGLSSLHAVAEDILGQKLEDIATILSGSGNGKADSMKISWPSSSAACSESPYRDLKTSRAGPPTIWGSTVTPFRKNGEASPGRLNNNKHQWLRVLNNSASRKRGVHSQS